MTSVINRTKKVLLILFILQIIFSIVNVSQAESWFSEWWNSANDFYEKGKNSASTGSVTTNQDDGSQITVGVPNDTDLQPIISNLYNILFPIGVAVTVIIGTVLGIKFMLASAEDKAKIKESLVPYVVGCIIIYGAFGIWKLAITLFGTLG